MLAPHLNALSLPGTFRLGPLRFPIYGIFATLGLIAALALSQTTARRTGLSPQKLWDAGMFAVVSAFLISRLLLVAQNFKVFLAVPMLVLTLPSLTYTGILLTAFLTWLYLYARRIPKLRALDAWAPCALVLAAFLQLGHFFEGTDAGMPTSLPWGIISPGDTMLGHTHPVQLYALILDLILAATLYRRMTQTKAPGQTTALALILGGLISFLLGFLRQPAPTLTPLPLDPAQIIALIAIALGIVIFLTSRKEVRHKEPSRLKIASLLEGFVDGTGGPWDFDDFISTRFQDPLLSRIQEHCLMLPQQYPANVGWCNDEGLNVIRDYIHQLRQTSAIPEPQNAQ